jgi:hypothetical protein
LYYSSFTYCGWGFKIQVTPVICAFIICIVTHPRFCCNVMMSIGVVCLAMVEAATCVHWVVLAVPLTRPAILTRSCCFPCPLCLVFVQRVSCFTHFFRKITPCE